MTFCDDCGNETDCYKVLEFGEICCKACYDSHKVSSKQSKVKQK